MNVIGTTDVGIYVFGIIAVLFFIQFLMSIIGSDLDISTDLDTSDIFSFKGIMHFLFGFSLIWSLSGIDSLTGIIIAVITGVIFVISLGWLYRFIYKNLSNEIVAEKLEDLVGRPAKIYIMLDNQHAIIKTTINGAEREIDAKFKLAFDDDNLPESGDVVNIVKVENNVLIVEY